MTTYAMLKLLGAVALGAVLGYGWYRLVGCPTGGCPITSNPWYSSIYGAVIGLFIALS
jgi:hypothetical protein